MQQDTVRALICADRDQCAGLVTLKQIVQGLDNVGLELTVIETSPLVGPRDEQLWGDCKVQWTSGINREEFNTLLADHDLWIEPTLTGGTSPFSYI